MHLSKSVETRSLCTSRNRCSVVYQLTSATANASRARTVSVACGHKEEVTAIEFPIHGLKRSLSSERDARRTRFRIRTRSARRFSSARPPRSVAARLRNRLGVCQPEGRGEEGNGKAAEERKTA